MALFARLSGCKKPRADPARAAARALAPRANGARDPYDDPGRTAHPGEDRARELRRLPPPPGAARLRLAAAPCPRRMKSGTDHVFLFMRRKQNPPLTSLASPLDRGAAPKLG